MQIEGSANSDYMESYENILVTADLITFIIHIKSDLKISTSFLHNFSDHQQYAEWWKTFCVLSNLHNRYFTDFPKTVSSRSKPTLLKIEDCCFLV